MLKLKPGEYVGVLRDAERYTTIETSPCIRVTARQALEDAKALAKTHGHDESYCYVQDATGILYEYDPSLEAVPTVEQTLGDLTHAEQQAVKLADKVVLGASWFAIVDGATVTGLMDGDQIDYDHMQAVDLSDITDAEFMARVRRAELMLQAVAHPVVINGVSHGAPALPPDEVRRLAGVPDVEAALAALVFAAGLGGAALEC